MGSTASKYTKEKELPLACHNLLDQKMWEDLHSKDYPIEANPTDVQFWKREFPKLKVGANWQEIQNRMGEPSWCNSTFTNFNNDNFKVKGFSWTYLICKATEGINVFDQLIVLDFDKNGCLKSKSLRSIEWDF